MTMRQPTIGFGVLLGALACGIGLDASSVIAEDSPDGGEVKDMQKADAHAHTNRLIDATSPYLLQHAHNPVDWYEWGEEAFTKAKKEDKPIFLSIGYSACHWCHVMEHETFESEEVADFVNERFVCVKVDREERPDVDEIYMHVTQMMNKGHGGWPMSVFLTSDREPIYAGTYFPKVQFMRLCEQIHTLWTTNRERIAEQSVQIRAALDEWAKGDAPDKDVIAKERVAEVATMLAGYFDGQKGGFRSDGNKFPPSMSMDLMLRVHRQTGDQALLDAVNVTLQNMADGGIYDHLGGGICRYSTDPDWLVPHFEKMLYDQALVSAIYLDAFQVTNNPRYEAVARDIFAYVMGDLQSEEGGFYSTRDADSEGMEGAFYIWKVEQIKAVLGDERGALFCEFYDVTDKGNWFESRGHAPAGAKNILRITTSANEFAKSKGIELADFEKQMATCRKELCAEREKRIHPGLDDKVLTGWNGLMIASLAKGARVLNDPQYAEAAGKAADFVLTKMRKDGRLLRTHRGGESRLTGYLSDYAFMIEGLLNLYEATFDPRWLTEAQALTDVTIKHYLDTEGGAFYFTADDAEKLIARSKNPRDGAIPSGNSVHAMNLVRLGIMLDRADYRAHAESIFKAFKGAVEGSPSQFERMLCAVDMYHDRVKEVVIAGDVGQSSTDDLVRAVYAGFLPNKILLLAGNPGGGRTALVEDGYALLKGKKPVDGKPAVYVCENKVCKRPVTDAAGLRKQLGFR
ncbi:MAG: hypothetical protein DHS20C16_32940 [Phycisphaerae bacterium]|nr:MAG: hypothetical protein DHS20C16_32940 [Phycisphaerae bacterium]